MGCDACRRLSLFEKPSAARRTSFTKKMPLFEEVR
jgi:hypothetical protein